jgi:hypothetical protein
MENSRTTTSNSNTSLGNYTQQLMLYHDPQEPMKAKMITNK